MPTEHSDRPVTDPTPSPGDAQDSSPRAFVSYAQNFEDVVLWRALGHIPKGRYVDVGAADPVVDSVTAAFYQRGWRGVNIEPVPEYASALQAERPGDRTIACGIGRAEGTARFTVVAGTGLSTFDDRAAGLALERMGAVTEIEVPVHTLNDVLLSEGLSGAEIHFLKIDVEGLEADVIAGASLAEWRPWVLVVEATIPGSTVQAHGEWEQDVLDAGYTFCLFDGLNRFYAHQSHPELVPILSFPACTFDQPFEQRGHHEVTRVLQGLQRHAAEIERQLEESRVEVQRRQVALDELSAAFEHSQGRLDRTLVERQEFAQNGVRWRREALQAQSGLAETRRALHDDRVGRSLAEAAYRDIAIQLANVEAELEAVRATLSWRVTTPLRSVRRRAAGDPGDAGTGNVGADRTAPSAVSDASISGTVAAEAIDVPETAQSSSDASGLVLAFEIRAAQATQLLHRTSESDVDASPDPIRDLAQAMTTSDAPAMAVAWLGYVAATGRYPDEVTVRSEARILRRSSPAIVSDHLTRLFLDSVNEGTAFESHLDVVTDAVVADVTHTAQHDLQTGIQRVVREVTARWLADHDLVTVWWDYGRNGLRRLGRDEVERLRNWRDHLPSSHGSQLTVRSFDDGPQDVVVPWGSTLLLPELTAEPARTEGYRALNCAGVLRGTSMIGYDIIPVTAAETVTEAMSHVFSLYLSMVKRSSRLSAISGAAAGDFVAFNAALASQGLSGPQVAAHLLPPSPAEIGVDDLDQVRTELGLGPAPMVLVVGSHEPRKNHMIVLEAAEALWAQGQWFDLVFIGGSGWRSEAFDVEVDRLISLNRPLQVRKRATETELWAAYRLARFSVFPSLLEGYGLPIVESIASGTPVITSNYGSMAEIGAGGGAVLVDPNDLDGLVDAMRLMLTDDGHLDRLRSEAASRSFPTWDSYAADVWDFLVNGE